MSILEVISLIVQLINFFQLHLLICDWFIGYNQYSIITIKMSKYLTIVKVYN